MDLSGSNSSSLNSQKGTLYICPTPIGNLDDLTFRAARILKEVDLIAAENTLHTQKLLNHYGISKPLISYFDSEKAEIKEEKLIAKLESGLNIALVSSAGTPLISDPGYKLIKKCIDKKIKIVPLPGPSAAVTALTISGISPHQFFFGGFLPSKTKARKSALKQIESSPCTLIFYEAPHRIVESLSDCLEILGNREAALVRELTKIYEETLRGKLSEILDWIQIKPIKGEITLVISGNQNNAADRLKRAEIEMESLVKKGIPLSQAAKEAAKKHEISKNKLYSRARLLTL
jgi:16S rRNA (cytidine1402-2'-O)-methyltransferase